MGKDVSGRKLRMAMIGGGPGSGIGDIHRKAALMDSQIELVAGSFSSNPEKSKAQGKALFVDSDRVYASWEKMLDTEAALPDDKRPDLISIVTPNHLHFAQAKRSLELGFHVVMDKPMTMTLAEALELRDLVKKTGKVFALTHAFATNAMVKCSRDLVAQGALGKIRKVVVEYPQGWLYQLIEKSDHKQASWRTRPELAGAGCIGDIGVHASHLSELVTGLRVTDVAADAAAIVEGRTIDDDFTALARWEGDVRGSIQASQISVGEGNGLGIRVYGDKAGLEWRFDNMDFLIIKYQDKPWEKWARGTTYVAAASPSAARVTRCDKYHAEGYIEGFANVYLNAALAIRKVEAGEPLTDLDRDFPCVDDGVRGMAFIEAMLESTRNKGAWVEIPAY